MRKIYFITAVFILGILAGCSSSDSDSDEPEALGSLPALTTSSIMNIGSDTASCGGNITTSDESSVTARGIVWGTSPNPTTADHKTVETGQLGTFTSTLTGLLAGTTYYVRAYATNAAGTAYGSQTSFTTLAVTNYVIGGFGPAGGTVFQVDASGHHGKEIAPHSTRFQGQWGCPVSSVPGTSAAVGSGQNNTNIILNYHNSINYFANPGQCTAVVIANGTCAAKNCANLVYNGYDDWYLPSIGELSLVYTNLVSQGLGNFGTSSTWTLSSSTQSATNVRMSMVLENSGVTWGMWKEDLTHHRAIRNF